MRKFTVLLMFALAVLPASSNLATAQSDSHYFPETGHTVKGRFLQYWQQHGGLSQQGYPISDELQERSDTDGKLYTVQYFERAVFELHPENQPPTDVLLSLLGSFRYREKYPNDAPNQQASTDNPPHLPRNWQDHRWQVPSSLGAAWWPGAVGLPDQQRVSGGRHRWGEPHRAIL